MNDFSRSDLDALKAQVDLAALMRSSGIDFQPAGQNLTALCPWHDDKTPSLVLNPKKQLYNCFGCEAKGDVLDFLQAQENLSFSAAVARLRELTGTHPVPERGAAPTNDPDRFAGGLNRPQLLARVAEHYKRGLSESAEAQEYLKSRGLGDIELWEAFGLGYCDGSLLRTVPKSGDTREALTQLGILNTKGREHSWAAWSFRLRIQILGSLGCTGDDSTPKPRFGISSCPAPSAVSSTGRSCRRQVRFICAKASSMRSLCGSPAFVTCRAFMEPAGCRHSQPPSSSLDGARASTLPRRRPRGRRGS